MKPFCCHIAKKKLRTTPSLWTGTQLFCQTWPLPWVQSQTDLTTANSGANNNEQKAPCASYRSSNQSTNSGGASSTQVEELNATMVEKIWQLKA